ncbi:membrane transporter, partial [Oryctes borbonicus]
SFQIFAAFAASISAFSIGNAIGWTSQISLKMTEGEMGFEITNDQLGWIGSLSAVGAAFMALIIGYICDKIGRKLAQLLLVLPMASGWGLLVWASNVPMLYAGRILTGMSMGAFMVTNPLYINEISQKEIRGILGSLTQLFISGGILFDAIVGKFASIQSYTLYCFVVPMIFGCVFIFMPETPIYYLRKGEEGTAEKVLKKLRSKEYDIESELENLKLSLSKQQEGNSFKIFKE